MVVTCALGSVVANRVGLKNALIFGTTGYCIYAASLYANNRYGTEWFVYLGATACGITAGIFWAAEGAIMISCTSSQVMLGCIVLTLGRPRQFPAWKIPCILAGIS